MEEDNPQQILHNEWNFVTIEKEINGLTDEEYETIREAIDYEMKLLESKNNYEKTRSRYHRYYCRISLYIRHYYRPDDCHYLNNLCKLVKKMNRQQIRDHAATMSVAFALEEIEIIA